MSVLTRIFLSLLRSSSSCPESNKEESYNTFFSLLICYNLQGRQGEELKQLAEASREFQEAFDYDEVPEEVLQWIFSQDTQVATIPATSGAPGSDSIRPAVPGEKLRIDYKALDLECF